MTATLLVDLNTADGEMVSVYLDSAVFMAGSAFTPIGVGDPVEVVAEGGIRCWATVVRVANSIATLRLDLDTWTEDITDYDEGFVLPAPMVAFDGTRGNNLLIGR